MFALPAPGEGRDVSNRLMLLLTKANPKGTQPKGNGPRHARQCLGPIIGRSSVSEEEDAFAGSLKFTFRHLTSRLD